MRKLWLSALLAYLCLGCIPVGEDPNTGKPIYKADPNAVKTIELGVETGIGVGGALSLVFPWLVPFVTAAGGAYVAYKKQKPKLIAVETRAVKAHSLTEALVHSIEDYKKLDEDGWVKLEARLKRWIGPEGENVIRAIRNLPPKL